MEVEVIYFGKLRDAVDGKTKEMISVDDVDDLKGLLTSLGDRYGKNFTNALDVAKGLRILVNGREYQMLSGMDTRLKDKDTVVLLPPIFGG
jgi:MoaD family protein